jgi:hypothetical protein
MAFPAEGAVLNFFFLGEFSVVPLHWLWLRYGIKTVQRYFVSRHDGRKIRTSSTSCRARNSAEMVLRICLCAFVSSRGTHLPQTFVNHSSSNIRHALASPVSSPSDNCFTVIRLFDIITFSILSILAFASADCGMPLPGKSRMFASTFAWRPLCPNRAAIYSILGRVIAHAVIRRLPPAAARVRSPVKARGICGGQSGTGAGFLRVLRFPLPILRTSHFIGCHIKLK